MNYLYNGVELPDIYTVYTPELQKTHPFAYIHRAMHGGGCYFEAYEEQAYWEENSLSASGYSLTYNSYTVGRISYFCETDGTTWVEQECQTVFGVEEYTFQEGASTKLYWANVDVKNPNGDGIYLAASAPIPVSTFTPDPISMTMGWLVGRRIAGQRK